MKKNHNLKIALAFAGTLSLAGCVVPGPVAYQPVPPPPMVVTQPVVTETEYIPAPNDVYISSVVDRDVVFVGGVTYIWFVGPDGVRHRHYYGRGDLRADVFHRREELRIVMAHHEGHLPMPGHDHPFPGHGVGHPPMGPHPEPFAMGHPPAPHPDMPHPGMQPMMPAHGPQPQMPQAMHAQMHQQQQAPAHASENNGHHPKQGG